MITDAWWDHAEFSNRTTNCMKIATGDDARWNDPIFTLRNLDKLMHYPNVGRKTINEIREYLSTGELPTYQEPITLRAIKEQLDRIEGLLRRQLCLPQ